VTGLAGSVGWSKDPSTAWLVPSTENRFLEAGKGAENTQKKSKQGFLALKVYTFGKVQLKIQGSELPKTINGNIKVAFRSCRGNRVFA
jgi:hypothetical protein